jgi:hypothetical protein
MGRILSNKKVVFYWGITERKRNVLDATQALEAVTSRLVKALVNVRGEWTRSGGKGCSFKEFYEHPFPMFKGNLNSGEARDWLMNLEELKLCTTLRIKESSTQTTSSMEKQGDGGTLRRTRW